VSLEELRVHAMHAFRAALGLPDCRHCDSMMSLAWRRRDALRVTDLDVRTFEALSALEVGSGPWRPTPRAAHGVMAEVPFINTGRGGSIDIDIAPEGEPSFVVTLDTGAVPTVLTTDYARALGVSVRSAKSDTYRRATVTGEALHFWVTGQHVVGGGRGPTHFNYALLGGEFLDRYVVDIDFEARRVRFLDPDVHRVGDLAGERVVELRVRERRPYAKLSLGNGSVWALVDTGAEAPISITEEKARELGIEVDRRAVRRGFRNVLGTSTEAVQSLPEVTLGPVTLLDPEVLIALADGSGVRVQRWLQDQTILGVEILENYRVRLDYPREKLGLTPIAD
jgi:predicted aspartyl protease